MWDSWGKLRLDKKDRTGRNAVTRWQLALAAFLILSLSKDTIIIGVSDDGVNPSVTRQTESDAAMRPCERFCTSGTLARLRVEALRRRC